MEEQRREVNEQRKDVYNDLFKSVKKEEYDEDVDSPSKVKVERQKSVLDRFRTKKTSGNV